MQKPSMMLTPEDFWQFSVSRYGKPGVADACLTLQDQFGINVNLVLLYCWCIEHNYQPSSAEREAMQDAVAQTNPAIELHRQKRRLAKNSPNYEAMKQAELELEAEQQRALVAALCFFESETETTDINDPIERLAHYLHVATQPDINPYLQAVL